MTSRWLKDDNGNFILGKNGKKLRYLYYKKTNKVQTTFDTNWCDDAINLLNEQYDNNVERVQTKRGRPKKLNNQEIKKVKRINEKRIDTTAATVDTSDEEETFNIRGYTVVNISGKSYYKNKKNWLFDADGIYYGHIHNDEVLNY